MSISAAARGSISIRDAYVDRRCLIIGKGRQVYVEGRLQLRKWTDREGTERITPEITANEIQFLGAPRGDRPEGAAAPSTEDAPTSTPDPDEIPF